MDSLFSNLIEAFDALLSWQAVLVIIAGVISGIIVGALPGLSPSMGVALLVPFTYNMPPSLALILLVAVYIAACYGGSITAITINTPGTAASMVTSFDGYPLTMQGRPGMALGVSIVASSIAGIIGSLILIFFSVPMASIAVRFHPAEYFALAMFGLATVASLAGQQWLKAFIAASLGLALNTVGTDPISGADRFTFGFVELSDGFNIIPALIGLFALSEVFSAVSNRAFQTKAMTNLGQEWPSFLDYWKLKWTIFLSALIGTIVGIFPGAGSTIASFLSYDFTKRLSKTPEEFGKGSLQGVATSESANSASVGGSLVPLLTLGIPGSATAAVLLGAMMVHKLTPGPQLFYSKPEIIYELFASMLIANIVLLGVGLLGSRIWIRITSVPRVPLYLVITVMCILGCFASRNAMFDVYCGVFFGIVGWLMKRHEFPVAPVILGLVLGSIAESNFRRAIMMDGPGVFFGRPLSAILLLIAALSFLIPLIVNWRDAKKLQNASTSFTTDDNGD
ncbi:MAG: tripartite tricarboxylate transporter permease [Verrucomicrobiales bacterium]|nr:tripartite tricarboxylate transporter permease [Verrucomicrobiales bacterium]